MSSVTMEWESRLGRRLRVRDLYILSTVVKAGSMAKAARQLAMSQPAVSQAIANLEHMLGVRLLDRDTRGIEPTIYAHTMLKRSMTVFDELKQSVRDIEFLSNPTAGELRIGCSETLAAGLVVAVIAPIAQRHPRIVFQVVTAGPSEISRDLMERKIELMIYRKTRDISEDRTVVESLFDDPLVVVAGLQNPWSRRRKIKLAELVNEPWTLPPLDTHLSTVVMEAFRANGLEPPRIALITQSPHVRNTLVTTSGFLTVLPKFALTLPRRHPSVKALPVDMPNAGGTVAFVTLRNRTLSPLAELFIDSLRSVAKPLARKLAS